MFGILRNGTKILSKDTNQERARIDMYGNLVFPEKSIWVNFEDCSNPYMEDSRWNVHSRMMRLQKIYVDDDLEMIEFSKETLELFVFNRLKGN